MLGSTPGLEVWNRASSSWLLIEKSDQPTAATLLVGRQLERLSNGRYHSGKHRVCAYPANSSAAAAAAAAASYTNPAITTISAAANASAQPAESPLPPSPSPTTTAASTPQFSLNSPSSSSNYRYSIVFVLRAHWPVPVDSSLLTTPITGAFTSPMSNMTAKDLFVSIERMCYNVNVELKERDKQRRRLHGGRNSKRGSKVIDD